MQTFLTDTDYVVTAAQLDSARLNKQITESYQILRALLLGTGWSNHRVTRMWRGHEGSLANYTYYVYREFCDRGGSIDHRAWLGIERLVNGRVLPARDPRWITDQRLLSSHRSRLLHKGMLDSCRVRAKLWGVTMLDICDKPKRLNPDHLREIHAFFDSKDVKPVPNWYDQFGWDEEPSAHYYWPRGYNAEKL